MKMKIKNFNKIGIVVGASTPNEQFQEVISNMEKITAEEIKTNEVVEGQVSQEEVKAKGGRTKITTKYTTSNKETKIIVNSPFIKEHCLFKDETVIGKDKEYRKALNFLCSYTMAGKNKNDDIPDAFAQLSQYVQSFAGSRVQIIKRMF